MRLCDLLTRDGLELTPAETKIVQILLAEYPIAGLGTATALAKRAGVSDPTVIRLVAKLGFNGFAEFQARLLSEVESGLQSPLMMMEAKRPAAKGRGIAQSYLLSAADAVTATADMNVTQAYERAVQLIAETKGRVVVMGGRFSRYIAGMLGAYLLQLRPNVLSLGILGTESFDTLLDLSERDTLIVFDYRRYQRDVIRYAQQAAERGVRVVLFTDPFRSPIADVAKIVIVGRMEVGSPYDSLAPAVAQMEALIAHMIADESRTQRGRVQELERIRAHNAVTLESAADPPAGRGPGRSRSKNGSSR